MKKMSAVLFTTLILSLFTACDSTSIDETYAPAAPTDLTVTEISAAEVTIAWSDNSENDRGFIIERAVDEGDYAEIDRTRKSTFSEDLPDNTIYRYRVTAYNDFGNSLSSDEAAVKRPVMVEEEIVKEDGAAITMGAVASIVIAPDGISGNGTIQAVEGIKEDSISEEQEPNLSILSDIKILTIADFTHDELTLIENIELTMNYEPAVITKFNADLDTHYADLIAAGVITAPEVEAYKLTAADLDIYYFDVTLGRWMKTRAVHDTDAGVFTLQSPYLGIYGIGFNLAGKTGISIEQDEELQNYLKETYDQTIEGEEETDTGEARCAASRAYTGYENCSYCPKEIGGVSSIGGVSLGCDNCSAPVDSYDAKWYYLFRSSCGLHDCCYNHGRMTYGLNKGTCDRIFFGNLNKKCSKKFRPFIKVFNGFCWVRRRNPNAYKLPFCMIDASIVSGVVSSQPEPGFVIPYDDQPCYDYLRRGINCSIPLIIAMEGEKYGCKENESINFTSEIRNIDDRPLTYSWTATGGSFDDPGASNVTWTAAGVSPGTEVTITLTISDGENSIQPVSKKVLVYQLERWIDWGVQTGSSSHEASSSIAMDLEGNLVIAGITEGAIPGEAHLSGMDVFIQKYSASGSLLWSVQTGTFENDQEGGIAVDDSGNVYIAGMTEGSLGGFINAGGYDIFLQKYDKDGELVWTQQSGTTESDSPSALTLDKAGNIYLVGSSYGHFQSQSNVGESDIFIQKYANDGTLLWTEFEGTISTDQLTCITVGRSGNIFTAGRTVGSFLGFDNPDSSGDSIMFKYSNSGDLIWHYQSELSGGDGTKGITTDRFGNIFSVGYVTEIDYCVRKYSRNGNLLWTYQIDGAEVGMAYDISVDRRGIITTVARHESSDFFILQNDIFGNPIRYYQTGTTEMDYLKGLVVGDNGAVFVTGYTNGSYASANQGGADIVLFKIKPE